MKWLLLLAFAFPLLAHAETDLSFQMTTRCVSAESLEVCTPTGCSTAPCMGGSFCLDEDLGYKQASCHSATDIQTSCTESGKKKITALIDDQTVEFASECPDQTPNCREGHCVLMMGNRETPQAQITQLH